MGNTAFIIHPEFKQPSRRSARGAEANLEEAAGLALAIDLEIMGSAIVAISIVKPATLMGSGKVEELAEHIQDSGAGLVIVNDSLSPVQQRNLEKAWNVKVIDRTALILEIFGARARTHEGKLQVELAALNYQKSRLVRSWTHLERQRGGFGFLGGPGESQIEIDRRLIRDRIAKLKRQLEEVTRTRTLHRKVRRDTPYRVVALVGYTNAGKSTLFNRASGAGVLAMDKLFATLDPTMRAIDLPTGERIILSDTVGFVSNLPTELVAAFRATLEEVLEADLILHVRDIAHPDSEIQKQDVEQVLKSLLATQVLPENILEVCNKADQLDDDMIKHLKARGSYVISALTGEGVHELLTEIGAWLQRTHLKHFNVELSHASGKALAWLYAHANVSEVQTDDEGLSVGGYISQENWARFEQRFDTRLAMAD